MQIGKSRSSYQRFLVIYWSSIENAVRKNSSIAGLEAGADLMLSEIVGKRNEIFFICEGCHLCGSVRKKEISCIAFASVWMT